MEYDAKGHAIPPYQGWRPYCLVCPTMHRMETTDFGWRCVACRNEIGKDLKHRRSE